MDIEVPESFENFLGGKRETKISKPGGDVDENHRLENKSDHTESS